MNAKKKVSAGVVTSLLTVILALAALVVYLVNIGGAGYFQNAAVTNLPLYVVLAVAALVLGVVLSRVQVKGNAGSLVSLLVGALQIAAPVLLSLCLITLLSGRVEGLGFIYFSNADVALEVQTAANLSSATGAIASMVCFGVSALVGMVSAFFNVKKD